MTHASHSAARPPLPQAFYLSLLGTLLFSLSVTILIPVVPLYVTDELGQGEQWIGTATLFVALAAVSLRIPGGAFSDRQGRRKVMLLGAVASIAASALYLSSGKLAVFLVARLLTGTGIGLYTTTGKALAADLAPPSRRGEAMGMTNAAFSMATIISPLLGEWLKNTFSFQAAFLAGGALAAASLAVTWLLPAGKPARDAGPGAGGDLRATLAQRGTWAALVLMLGMGAILALMFTFFPLLAERKDLFADAPGALSKVAIGLGLSIWALTDTLVEPVAGRISDRVGRQIVAVPGLVVAVIGVVAISRAADTASTYAALAFMTVGWGTARAAADSIAQDAVPPALRGMAVAVVYSAFDLAVGANAQLLSGLIDGADFSAFFAALIALVVVFGTVGVLLATRLRTYEQRTTSAPPPVMGD